MILEQTSIFLYVDRHVPKKFNEKLIDIYKNHIIALNNNIAILRFTW
jgi:hypothetical protein